MKNQFIFLTQTKEKSVETILLRQDQASSTGRLSRSFSVVPGKTATKNYYSGVDIAPSSCTNSGTSTGSNAFVSDRSVHPNSMNSGAVISTDTTAYRVLDAGMKKYRYRCDMMV